MNSQASDISINIYNLSGHLVDKISKNDLSVYEYNEIPWDVKNLLPGLYFAEIITPNGQEDIIKVVIGY